MTGRRAWISVGLIMLMLAGCSRQQWQAIGYYDRDNPDAASLSLGVFSSEEESRLIGMDFVKRHPKGDYIIGKISSSGGIADTRR